MDFQVKDNRAIAEKVVKVLIENTAYTGFSYDTFFVLQFDRGVKAEFEGNLLPRSVQLEIMTDWWLDSPEEWNEKVDKLKQDKIVEPIEPVFAYELTCLKWMDGSEVKQVIFSEDSMIIEFKNDRTITVSIKAEMDYSWIIHESNVPVYKSSWYVICDNEDLFAGIPSNL